MSTFFDQARSRVRIPVTTIQRPRLTLVPKVASRASRIPFVIVVVALLVSGLVGLLLLNTSLQSGAFRLSSLQEKSSILARHEQALELAVTRKREPQHLLRAARRLGMVWVNSPSFLSLKTGRISGQSATTSTPVTIPVRTGTAQHIKLSTIVAGTDNSLAMGSYAVAKPAHHPNHSGSKGHAR